MRIALWILLGCCVSLFVYACYFVLDTYAKVKLAPREAMFLCSKHGPIRKKHVIHFQIGPEEFVDYCPRCFNERLTDAERVV